MGEEKPDEELMGKRKSSPRLSPMPLGTGTIILNIFAGSYTFINEICCKGCVNGGALRLRMFKLPGSCRNLLRQAAKFRFHACNCKQHGLEHAQMQPETALALRVNMVT